MSPQEVQNVQKVRTTSSTLPKHGPRPTKKVEDEVEKDVVTKQIEQIEQVHTGLKDMQTMSEMTALSRPMRPLKPKEY